MKQFNLEEYLKNPSKEVVTRDGRKVRIVCTDVKSINPILALVSYDEGEVPSLYDKNGKYNSSLCLSNDLFFAPEKKEGWVNILGEVNGGCYVGHSRVFNSKEKAEEKGKSYCSYVATVKIEWEE